MNKISKLSSFILRLLFVAILFVVLRNLMYFFNTAFFQDLGFQELLWVNFVGLRFDVSAILLTNAIVILLYLVPFRFCSRLAYRWLLGVVFVVINSINIIVNLSDIIYFRFTLRRTTAEIVNMFVDDASMFNLIPTFLYDFWYIALVGIALIGLLIVFTIKTDYCHSQREARKGFSVYLKSSSLVLLIIAVLVLGIRGGTQKKPITIIDSFRYNQAEHTPLVLNTSFTLLKTYGKIEVEQKSYFAEEELLRRFDPVRHYVRDEAFRPLNVVVIIMEGMSKEHSALLNPSLNGKGFTPFFDQLAKQSLLCTHAYANGHKSIDGVSAILTSFPTMINDAIVSSIYSSSQFTSLANTLEPKGYTTLFAHGGNNGTMRFDNFMQSIGFQYYYGRNEYGTDKDYDGKWGVYDDKFFKFFGEKLNQTPEPFLATLFTLSAHHPFRVPPEFENTFPEGKIPVQKTVAYADYALKIFFEEARHQDWYENTLFVVTADHVSENADEGYNNPVGYYAIPILYYMPSDNLVGVVSETTQQLDILPSVLNYLNYDLPFYSLGESVFSERRYPEAINFNNGAYHYIAGQNLIQYDGRQDGSWVVNDLSQWPALSPGLLPGDVGEKKARLQALIQGYNRDLGNNRMFYAEPK